MPKKPKNKKKNETKNMALFENVKKKKSRRNTQKDNTDQSVTEPLTKKNKISSMAENIKEFKQLTPEDSFMALKICAYFDKVSFNQKIRNLIIFARVNEQPVNIVANRDCAVHFLHKFDSGQWYDIHGGKINVYKGQKDIKLSMNSIIKKNGIQKIMPKNDFRKNKNILLNYNKIKKIPTHVLEQYFLGGWVIQIGKKMQYNSGCCVPITIADCEGVCINVNLWEDQDQKVAKEKLKINVPVLFTKWRLKKTPHVLLFNNSGPILFEVKLPEKRKICELGINLSEIDLQQIQEQLSFIKFAAVIDAVWKGGITNKQMFRLLNVKFVEISRVFQFKDENNKNLTQGIEDEFMDENGNKRCLDLERDSVCFFLRIRVQDIVTKKNVWMSGFDKCGENLFGKNGKELFQEQHIDMEELSNMLQDKVMDVIISGYSNTKNGNNKGCLWTIESIMNIYAENESDSDMDIESQKTEKN